MTAVALLNVPCLNCQSIAFVSQVKESEVNSRRTAAGPLDFIDALNIRNSQLGMSPTAGEDTCKTSGNVANRCWCFFQLAPTGVHLQGVLPGALRNVHAHCNFPLEDQVINDADSAQHAEDFIVAGSVAGVRQTAHQTSHGIVRPTHLDIQSAGDPLHVLQRDRERPGTVAHSAATRSPFASAKCIACGAGYHVNVLVTHRDLLCHGGGRGGGHCAQKRNQAERLV